MEGLRSLHGNYSSQGLEILAFPCSQFYNQAPGTHSEFLDTLRFVRPGGNYVPPFPVFSTIDVNGDGTAPAFSFLRGACPSTPGGLVGVGTNCQNPKATSCGAFAFMSWGPISTSDVSWNFEKFLVDKDGRPVKRYAPAVLPNDPGLLNDIQALLQE